MKNAIQYYYNLNIVNIYQANGIYKFTIDDNYYVLSPYEGNLDEIDFIYDLTIKMATKGIYCHQIVLNNENKIITNINNNPYIMLKSFNNLDEKIKLEHIIMLSNSTGQIEYNDILKRDNWSKLWSEKIDYFEYQVNQFGKSYPNLRESFSYFVGLAETGINLYNNSKIDYKNLVVSHKRIKKNNNLFDFYNPLSFIVDIKIRDACEYFKESFVSNEDIFNDIVNYFNSSSLTQYEYTMFFIRMLYPSFYFDLFEEIIKNNKDDIILLPIIKLANKYEDLIRKIYNYLSTFISLPEIHWIKKT